MKIDGLAVKLYTIKQPMNMDMNFDDYKGLVYKIVGASINVQKELNWGLLENIYTEALHYELLDLGILNEKQKYLPCFYKNRVLNTHYQMDIVVENKIIIELKSVSSLISGHRAQLFNYMRLTRKRVGLLINFGEPTVQVERYGLIESTNECILLDKDMQPVQKRHIPFKNF